MATTVAVVNVNLEPSKYGVFRITVGKCPLEQDSTSSYIEASRRLFQSLHFLNEEWICSLSASADVFDVIKRLMADYLGYKISWITNVNIN